MNEWGDRLLLFCGLLSLLAVTEADQGEKATTAETMVKKADQGIKADPARAGQHIPGTNALVMTGKTDTKKQ